MRAMSLLVASALVLSGVSARVRASSQMINVVEIIVGKNNVVYWNGRALQNDVELKADFASIAEQSPKPEVHFTPSRTSNYRRVAQFIALAQRYHTSLYMVGNEQTAPSTEAPND